MNAYTVVTRKGQITIPAEIRRALGIEQGDRIEVLLSNRDPRHAVLRPVPSVTESTYGLAGARSEPIDITEYDRAVEEEIVAHAIVQLGLKDRSRE
jgi:AbrB family looped-hinge helix DNA binding protein